MKDRLLGGLAAAAARGGGLALTLIVLAATMATGILAPLEDGLAAARFGLLGQAGSGRVTVVEIDAPSLRAAGRWPWGRERFAQAIDNLHAAGAEVIGFDVDFSAHSSPEGDARLRAAIERRPGTVVLPTFVDASGRGGAPVAETIPLGALSDQAVLASVNVPVDRDGRVRRYFHGVDVGAGEVRTSLAAVLAGTNHGRAGDFLLDYGFKADAVDRLSFQAVHDNRFDPAKVKGRAVLIGATALELGDEFATPAGTLSGVFVHALAVEALAGGRALQQPRPIISFLLAAALILLLRPNRRGAPAAGLLRRHLAAAALIVGAPLALQATTPISLAVAPLAAAQALCLIWAAQAELSHRARAIVKAREEGLLHLAMHQSETELPNRRALLVDIAGRLEGASPCSLAVITVGIDRDATLRGAAGYAWFNQLVREVAARVSAACGGTPTAHLSTSVVGLVLSGDEATVAAGIAALKGLNPSYVVGDHPADAFLRLGVAYAEAGGDTAETLLERATIALDQARSARRPVVVFDAAGYADPLLNLALMSEMRRGLEDGQLTLHYQPKVEARSGRLTGAEALVRWRHPLHGPISPDVFIGAAEETGSIREFTEWSLRRVMADSARLRAAGHAVRISVNVSGRLLADSAFCDFVLALTNGRTNELCLEVTETAVIEDPAAATAAIALYRAAGLKVSIDDYGVGLSSLSYLKMLEADELKVDKSLVAEVADSERDRLILKSTIDLAHGLGMEVVAEGVETPEVRRRLVELGCDTVQGYLIARPMPIDDMLSFAAGPALVA
jgi:diguanylate cyclase